MTCPTCSTYAANRGDIIKREIARQGEAATVTWEEFLVGVHERHLRISRQVVRILAQAMGPA